MRGWLKVRLKLVYIVEDTISTYINIFMYNTSKK